MVNSEAIAPPGQEGWREAPGWLFHLDGFCVSNLDHHPVCGFAAATPPCQAAVSKLGKKRDLKRG